MEDKTVKTALCEEPSEERLVHETEARPIVETIIKVESTKVEKYSLKLEHSTKELKQEEAKRNLPLEEIRKLETSIEQLADKMSVWLDSCSRALSFSSHPGTCFSEAHHCLTTHVQLQSQSETANEDAKSMMQMLDQLRSLCPDSLGDPSVYPKLRARVEVMLKDLSTVNTTIQSKLQLLQPYVIFLQTAEEVQVDFEHLKRSYNEKTEVDETAVEARWHTALQKLHVAQEQGNTYKSHLNKITVPGLSSASVVRAVMDTLERLNLAKDEVEEQYQAQMCKLQQDKLYCLKYKQRLGKTLADLQCVSELLDSCIVIDLGSEENTSRLRQQFTQARPHFTQLDAEANFITANFDTVRQLQLKHGPRISENVTEEDVSALLDQHLRLKQKIEESESILELSSSLHLVNKQLEELLETKPTPSHITACAEEKLHLLEEQKEQIHNLFNRASNLKKDICDGIRNSSVAGFRVEQLQSSLQCLDAQCVSWLSQVAQCEEAVLREMKTQALLKDINQLRDSFKDLKKRFSNLKFNYQKRNDRSRNIKAAKNQLQQVDVYEDKLEGLKSRLLLLTARVHSEVKDGGGARELEDLLNELHRQMGECEHNVREHHKTLDMTCTLQEAMDEYQFWCEEASGTISRVGKFSSECCSPEAVSAYTDRAEEGKRYIEKTIRKHSEMVSEIRKLSDGLLELEAKLKLESLEKKQKDEEEVLKEDRQAESNKQKDTEVNLEKTKDREKFDEQDNRTAQEAAEMYELKETGHTPELTNKHDGREIPVRRHSFNKKPPLQKNRTQETDRQTTSSFSSTHTFSLSCSPLESNRQVYAIISQSQPTLPTQDPPSRDAKREEKETAAESLMEKELQTHHDVLSEDSLSTDEYDCPSPDDISLPPLAETPESFLVQSDLDEGCICFSSQHSYRSQAQSEHRNTSETNVQGVDRVRTESGSFVPSPATIPMSTHVQSETATTVHSITIEENSITTAQTISSVPKNIPAQTSAEPTSLLHTHKKQNSPQNAISTSSTNVSKEVPNFVPDKNFPNSFHNSIHQEIICLEVTKLNSSEDCEKSLLDHQHEDTNTGEPSMNVSTVTVHNEDFGKNPGSSDSSISKGPLNDTNSSANGESNKTESQESSSSKNTTAVSVDCLTTTILKETLHSQSSIISTSLVPSDTSPSLDLYSHHQSQGQDNLLHEQRIDGTDELRSQNKKFKEAIPKSFANNFPTQELIASSTQDSGSTNHLNPSSNTTSNIKQNHQTVDSFHETSSQQCVHDSSFSAELVPTPTLLPEAKTQALAQLANSHVTPFFTSHQLLTTDQDPDICQPCTIREEITLTPQIKGPSIQAHVQDESSCFTKPVSKATVMGGSPVTLEVEVTGQPEPTLTWWVAYNQLHKYT
ncbi:hypothetical protein WMY93_003375 [Mugilogobius chulae]|uniref:Ig-like domain-containing protein n=1 Tax=Mugilogobius chulae TaxID=88201 RepID=A0AAW0Q7D6_9GOBI